MPKSLMTNQEKIIKRINELYNDGLVDEKSPISTVLETLIAEFDELGKAAK